MRVGGGWKRRGIKRFSRCLISDCLVYTLFETTCACVDFPFPTLSEPAEDIEPFRTYIEETNSNDVLSLSDPMRSTKRLA